MCDGISLPFFCNICVLLLDGLETGIFGGVEVKPHSKPYMASLQSRKHHVCGGVLIREDFVLTSAHCLESAVLGAHNISRHESSQQRIGVSRYNKHPLFLHPAETQYDMMLLRLKRNASLNGKVRPLPLPKDSGKIATGQQCAMAGWGMRRPGGLAETVLMQVQVQVEDKKKCKGKWKRHFNTNQMLCSESRGGKGFCQGDSGGPLVCHSVLRGVAAYTSPECTNSDYPQVYMDVSFFLPWIKNVMDNVNP
uniref:trypsin n=1 Tax=Denticeps clupeoides TaxID=299321 RepID=A0AAY4BKT9_9TELE